MSQPSDKEKSFTDSIEEGLSSLIDKTKAAASDIADNVSKKSQELVEKAKYTGEEMIWSDEEEGGLNAVTNSVENTPSSNEKTPSTSENTPSPSSNEVKELENPVEDLNDELAAVIEEELVLKLGDLIYVVDPTNEILNDNTFII